MAPYKPPKAHKPTLRFAEKFTPSTLTVALKPAPISTLGMNPLSARAQVEAETEFMNEERMMDFGWGSQEEDSMGTSAEPSP